MSVYLNENEEAEFKAKIEEFDRQKAEEEETNKINAKARRQKGDRYFQRIGLTCLIIIFGILIIRWLML